jgi:hypothetical protein
MASVDVHNLRKIHQRDSQEIVVLDGMSLQVPDGEFVALSPRGSPRAGAAIVDGGAEPRRRVGAAVR